MTKKYKIKPGMHQFVPGSGAAIHQHDGLTDEEIDWYLERYPHVAQLIAENVPEPEEEHANVIELKSEPKQSESEIFEEGSEDEI